MLGELSLIEQSLTSFQVGKFVLLEQKEGLLSEIKEFNFKRQISLVFSVLSGILSVLFVLIYFRVFIRTKI